MMGQRASEEAEKRPLVTFKSSGEYSQAIVDSYTVLYSTKSGLLKLQAVIASNCGHPQLSEILSIALNCFRDMRLTNPGSIEKVFQNADDQLMVKRSISFLCCLETRHSVFRGMPPLLQSEHLGILHLEPGNWDAGNLLTYQLAAATWLGTTFSRVYSPHAQHKKTSERLAEIQAREGVLAAWHAALPDDIQKMLGGRLPRGWDASMRLRVFCGYHECVYLLFGPWIRPAILAKFQNGGSPAASPFSSTSPSSASSLSSSSGNQETEYARYGGAADPESMYALGRCLESAYTIISGANEILSLDRSLARRIYDLMTVSLCVVVYGIKFGHPSVKKQATVHLGICCGVFCSLHMVDNALPFEEVLDVVKLIHSDN
ncbi:hypothetical protein PG999_012745 [Apiospora kogelbergensis]|uniref:Uncharacterized protein n=1 Tax=Apiospora kogelbergensis TaxID=1337665 RepID=A0AAW0QBU9_9PEZI